MDKIIEVCLSVFTFLTAFLRAAGLLRSLSGEFSKSVIRLVREVKVEKLSPYESLVHDPEYHGAWGFYYYLLGVEKPFAEWPRRAYFAFSKAADQSQETTKQIRYLCWQTLAKIEIALLPDGESNAFVDARSCMEKAKKLAEALPEEHRKEALGYTNRLLGCVYHCLNMSDKAEKCYDEAKNYGYKLDEHPIFKDHYDKFKKGKMPFKRWPITLLALLQRQRSPIIVISALVLIWTISTWTFLRLPLFSSHIFQAYWLAQARWIALNSLPLLLLLFIISLLFLVTFPQRPPLRITEQLTSPLDFEVTTPENGFKKQTEASDKWCKERINGYETVRPPLSHPGRPRHEVLLAWDNAKLVVLKILLEESEVEIFRSNAFRAWKASFACRYFPTIIEPLGMVNSGPRKGKPYMVMEYFPGETLQEYVAEEGLPVERVWTIASQVAHAIDALRENGIGPHLDICPLNILIREEENSVIIALIDFADKKPGETQYSPAKKSIPNKGEPNWKWDIYALAHLIYFMFTGKEPDSLESMEKTLKAQLELKKWDPVSIDKVRCIVEQGADLSKEWDSARKMIEPLKKIPGVVPPFSLP